MMMLRTTKKYILERLERLDHHHRQQQQQRKRTVSSFHRGVGGGLSSKLAVVVVVLLAVFAVAAHIVVEDYWRCCHGGICSPRTTAMNTNNNYNRRHGIMVVEAFSTTTTTTTPPSLRRHNHPLQRRHPRPTSKGVTTTTATAKTLQTSSSSTSSSLRMVGKFLPDLFPQNSNSNDDNSSRGSKNNNVVAPVPSVVSSAPNNSNNNENIEYWINQAQLFITNSDLGLSDTTLLDDVQFRWISPTTTINSGGGQLTLTKTEYITAGRFFNLKSTFPDLDYRPHDFRKCSTTRTTTTTTTTITIRCTCRVVGTMRNELRLRSGVIAPTGRIMKCPPEAISITYNTMTGKVVKLCTGFVLDRGIGNTLGTTGVVAASMIAGEPYNKWEQYPFTKVLADIVARPMKPLSETTTFIAPFPETVMIQLARGILSTNMATNDPTLLSPTDFTFITPTMGPIRDAKSYIAKYASNILPANYYTELNIDHYRIDPYDPSRVWVDVCPTGRNIQGPPEALSMTFDDDGYCTRITAGAVMDPTIGNTGGLCGMEGCNYAMGQSSWSIFTRPLPQAIGRFRTRLLSPLTGINVDTPYTTSSTTTTTSSTQSSSSKSSSTSILPPVRPLTPPPIPQERMKAAATTTTTTSKTPAVGSRKNMASKGTDNASSPVVSRLEKLKDFAGSIRIIPPSISVSLLPPLEQPPKTATSSSSSRSSSNDSAAAAAKERAQRLAAAQKATAEAQATIAKAQREAAQLAQQQAAEKAKQLKQQQQQAEQKRRAEQQAAAAAQQQKRQKELEQAEQQRQKQQQKAEAERKQKEAAEKKQREQEVARRRQAAADLERQRAAEQQQRDREASARRAAAAKAVREKEEAAAKARQQSQLEQTQREAAAARRAAAEKATKEQQKKREIEAQRAAAVALQMKMDRERKEREANAELKRREAEAQRVAALAAAETKKLQRAREQMQQQQAENEKRRREAMAKAKLADVARKANERTKTGPKAISNKSSSSDDTSGGWSPSSLVSGTISLFGLGKKELEDLPAPKSAASTKKAPLGVPTVRRWRKNADQTISGLVSGSRSFEDGARITTSPIASGTIASGEVVKTGSGSRYFLE